MTTLVTNIEKTTDAPVLALMSWSLDTFYKKHISFLKEAYDV